MGEAEGRTERRRMLIILEREGEGVARRRVSSEAEIKGGAKNKGKRRERAKREQLGRTSR